MSKKGTFSIASTAGTNGPRRRRHAPANSTRECVDTFHVVHVNRRTSKDGTPSSEKSWCTSHHHHSRKPREWKKACFQRNIPNRDGKNEDVCAVLWWCVCQRVNYGVGLTCRRLPLQDLRFFGILNIIWKLCGSKSKPATCNSLLRISYFHLLQNFIHSSTIQNQSCFPKIKVNAIRTFC